MRATKLGLVAVVGALALACGGGGSAAPAVKTLAPDATIQQSTEATQSPAGSSTPGAEPAAFAAYQQCLEEHGVPPGPGFGRGGFGSQTPTPTPEGATPEPTIDPAVLDAARSACASLLPPGGFGGTQTPEDQAQRAQAIADFVACMGAHGVAVSTPDPGVTATPDGGFGDRGIRGLLGNLDTNDPTVAAAIDACRSTLDDFGFGGPNFGSPTPTPSQ